MSAEYNPYDDGDFEYGPALDLLVGWCRTRAFSPEDLELLETMAAEWETLGRMADRDALLTSGMEKLTRIVSEALDLLHGPVLLDIEPGDEADVMSALERLDHCMFLSFSDRKGPDGKPLPTDFLLAAEALQTEISEYRAPSGLRLSQVNALRREMLIDIPEPLRQWFPWYTEHADLQEDTIERLIQGWPRLVKGDSGGIDLDPEVLGAVLADLYLDDELKAYIHQTALKVAAVIPALERSLPLRFVTAAILEASRRTVSPTVMAAGLVACASRVLDPEFRPIGDASDRLERMLMAAICAPLLSEKQRIELMEVVELALPACELHSLSEDSSLRLLIDWREGRRHTTDCVGLIFDKWEGQLEVAAADPKKVAAGEPAAIGDELERMRHLAKRIEKIDTGVGLREKGIELVAAVAGRMVSAGAGLQERIRELVYARRAVLHRPFDLAAITLSAESGSPTFEFSDGNVLELDLVSDEAGVLSVPGEHTDREDVALLMGFIQGQSYFWFGWIETPTGEVRPLADDIRENGPGREICRVPCQPEPPAGVLVAVSDDSRVLHALKNMDTIPEEDAQRIVCLFYQTPKEAS